MKSPLDRFRRDTPSPQSPGTNEPPEAHEQSAGISSRFKQLLIASVVAVILKRSWDRVTRMDDSTGADTDRTTEGANDTTFSIGRIRVGALLAVLIMGIVTYRRIRHR